MPDALQFLILTVAGWVNRHQEELIDVRGKQLGRRALMQVAGIVTPDTILRWYQRLIAQKYVVNEMARCSQEPINASAPWMRV
jgi:hypothetical protein